MSTIQIPHCHGIRIAQPEEIIRVEASSNYCKIYFSSGGPMLVAKVLLWFEKKLPEQMFTRIHRRHLVNNTFIAQVNMAKQSTILLSNGEMIKMSRRKRALLMAG
jgi:two-component system, LytTR family, response regulator